MTQQIIDLGQLPDGAGGDTNRSANVKCNENFSELYGTMAAKGDNRDITSLSGLTTPLSVEQGGTGATTPAMARASIGIGAQDTLSVASIEIASSQPHIDFQFNHARTDYDVRLINSASGTLNVEVANSNEFRIKGFTVWNDENGAAKIVSFGAGGVGSYGFFLVNAGLTPGAVIHGSNIQYAYENGNGQVSPIGTWRCMGDTVAGGRTVFQRVL